MKNHFKVIRWIASLTACCILLFQAFWVYRTYQTSEENFHIRMSTALQHSVDTYLLERIETPVSLTDKSPSLSILSSFSRNEEGSNDAPIRGAFKHTGPVKISFQPLKIDTANLESVRLFLAKMIVLSNKEKIALSEIRNYFDRELKKEDIAVDYKLSLHWNPDRKSKERITASLGRGKGDWVIEAKIMNKGGYLLSRNAVPAIISLFLIILTAGSLWYMWFIISRQKQLDGKKNDFINNLTHELRTPISILKSTNEALLQFGEASNAEKTSRYLQINSGVLNKLDEDIERLLNITRYELGARTVYIEQVNVPDLIRTIIEKFQLKENSNISFESRLESEILSTDKYMIEAIITNLIDNALKYTDDSAKIVVKVSDLTGGWQLKVRDNGQGISKENLPLIFDKFYRVTSGDLHEVKGYGIGLSYVRQLVILLGGEINVKSQIGEGTTFIIKFPL